MELNILTNPLKPLIFRTVYLSADPDMRYRPQAVPFYVDCSEEPPVQEPGFHEDDFEMQHLLMPDMMVQYDEKDAIGRRYRRQDAIGTPFCITVDNDTLTDNAVTVRHRDTMQQERVSIDQLPGYLKKNL